MRRTYRNILKHQFCTHLVHTRTALGMPQAAMVELLAMDVRSYIDLDQGRTCCSAVTLALYLIYICDDVKGFLEDLRDAFEIALNQAA